MMMIVFNFVYNLLIISVIKIKTFELFFHRKNIFQRFSNKAFNRTKCLSIALFYPKGQKAFLPLKTRDSLD